MNIPLSTDELVHIADLLREDVMACTLIAEQNPGDVRASDSIELSKRIMVRITLASLEPNRNDDTYTDKSLNFSERPSLN